MIKKCSGCGAIFQSSNKNGEGYIESENYDKAVICKRCFRIKNYGEYNIVNKDNLDYKKIFDEIKEKKDLVLFLCDILKLDDTLNKLNDFKGRVILIITKLDLLPKSVKEQKIINYILSNYKLNICDILCVSSNKNYNLDRLMNLIYKYKTSNNVYLVGNTNAGKSSLINAIIKSYSEEDSYITTSNLPATTLNTINVKLNDKITFIDTPGLVLEDEFLSNLSSREIKEVSCKVEIKPRTYQIKPNQSLIIGKYARIDYLSNKPNSITLYLSNNIKVKRINIDTNDYLRDLKLTKFKLDKNKDIVISGLCFCKIVDSCHVNVYTKNHAKVFERNNLI